jgi:hypothetical protein
VVLFAGGGNFAARFLWLNYKNEKIEGFLGKNLVFWQVHRGRLEVSRLLSCVIGAVFALLTLGSHDRKAMSFGRGRGV